MKRTFTDTDGRKWTPKLTLFEAARVKRQLDINMEELDDITRMVQDPALLCDVLFVVCETEANARCVNAETFGRSLAGDAIKAARQALLMAVSDFFEDTRKRTAFSEYIQAMTEEGDKTLDLIMKSTKATKRKIREQGDEFRASLQKELGNPEMPDSGEPSGGLPESSEA